MTADGSTSTDAAVSSPAPPKPERSWRWWVWRLTRSALVIYLGVCIVLYALQSWLIFPGHATQGTPAARLAPSRHYELLELKTASGDKIVALFGTASFPNGTPLPPEEAATRPTILFFYGNGMCLADATQQFHQFRRLGANVMIPDFAGYGLSGGKPSEKSFYQTADACWAHLVSRDDIDKTRIVAAGWSIGGGVAVDLAARERAAGLVLFSPFTSMGDMAQHLLPWLPAKLLLKHRFDNEAKIRSIDVPTLIVHGQGDRIIPFEMSPRLARAAKGPVTSLWLETDHNDLFDLGEDQMKPVLERFLSEVGARPR